jgi:hypothetical protein
VVLLQLKAEPVEDKRLLALVLETDVLYVNHTLNNVVITINCLLLFRIIVALY